MFLLLFYFSLAILVSFLCSILESVLLSLTPSHIAATKKHSPRTGRILDNLKTNVDRPLAAILTLNTIAHTVGAAGVGAQAQLVFQSLPLSLISGVLTLLILVFSEIIPKTLGAVYWRPLAVPSAYITKFLIYLLYPFVLMSQGISRFLSPHGDASTISREELNAMADLGRKEGVIDAQEARVLRSAVSFPKVRVKEVMTPRPVVKTFMAAETVRAVMDEEESLQFSRCPVLSDAENLKGYVLRSEILASAARDEWSRTMGELSAEVIILPENASAKHALAIFTKRREHLAVVVNEFGVFSGVVTLEDVIETLIGQEIMDEFDEVEDMRVLARQVSGNKGETTAEEKDPPS